MKREWGTRDGVEKKKKSLILLIKKACDGNLIMWFVQEATNSTITQTRTLSILYSTVVHTLLHYHLIMLSLSRGRKQKHFIYLEVHLANRPATVHLHMHTQSPALSQLLPALQ